MRHEVAHGGPKQDRERSAMRASMRNVMAGLALVGALGLTCATMAESEGRLAADEEEAQRLGVPVSNEIAYISTGSAQIYSASRGTMRLSFTTPFSGLPQGSPRKVWYIPLIVHAEAGCTVVVSDEDGRELYRVTLQELYRAVLHARDGVSVDAR